MKLGIKFKTKQRINYLIKKLIFFLFIQISVLDEADRCLDMGFQKTKITLVCLDIAQNAFKLKILKQNSRRAT